MKKTVTININGRQFFIDEDAFSHLNDYLKRIENSFRKQESGDEIISDIESRIAELFEEKINRANGVVTIELVNEIISIMGDPEDMSEEDDTQSSKQHTTSTALVKPNKRFYRDVDNRVLGGVCAGIAAYFNIDVVIVRIIALILIPVTSGTIIFVYAVLWIALPPALTTAQKLEMRGRHITINTIEQSIRDEYDEMKKNFKDFKKSNTYKKGEGFFSRFNKRDKTVLIVIAIAIGLITLSNSVHGLPGLLHAPIAVFTGITHGIAPGFNHFFFPGAFPLMIVLVIVGLVFKPAFKTILYIIAILMAGSLLIKMLFWIFGGIFCP